MDDTELAAILRDMFRRAPYGKKELAVHLFGIKYADELWRGRVANIARLSGLPTGYDGLVNYGRNLAPYVDLRESDDDDQR